MKLVSLQKRPDTHPQSSLPTFHPSDFFHQQGVYHLQPEEGLHQNLPLPQQDFTPQSIEEQIVCYADKFYSKTRLDVEKTPEQALRSLEKFGSEGLDVFRAWMTRFE